MPTFKAAMIRATLRIQSSTTVPGAAANVSTDTKHQFWLKPAALPTPGTPASLVQIVQRSGAVQSASQWIQDYMFNCVRPRYRLGGGAGAFVNWGQVDLEYLEEGSDAGLYITSYVPVTTGWIQAAGTNRYAGQLITTFRTAGGAAAKLVYNNGITPETFTIRIPTADTGIQGFADYLVGSQSCAHGRDGTPFIAAMAWNGGTNEKLWKDFFRS